MSTDTDMPSDNVSFTTEGKLRHENKFLQDRVANLETFKQNFFSLHYDLIDAREKISQLEEQLNLDKIKQNITSSESNPAKVHEKSDDLLEYFNSALTAASLQDLVMSLFQSADGLAKDIVVQIRDDGNLLDFCLDEAIKNDSLSLINSHQDGGSVVKLENKTILNHKHLSLIYSPVELTPEVPDSTLQEYMEILTLGANTRTSTLKQRTELNTLRENIFKIFKKMNQSFDTLQNDLEENIIIISTIYTDFTTALTENLLKMKLDDAHVSLINMITDDTKSDLMLALTRSMTLDKDFLRVLKKLEKAYSDAHE